MKVPVILAALFLIPWSTRAEAQTTEARVADAYGVVERLQSPDDTRWQVVSVGDLLGPNTVIRTGDNSAALLILLPDKHAFRIGEQAQVRLKEIGLNKSYLFELLRGQIWSFVDKARKPAKYEIETPSTVLGVSGTLFSLDYDEQTNQSEMTVVDGEVTARQGEIVHRVRKDFALRFRSGQTDPGRLEKLDNETREMWNQMRRSESWTKRNNAPRIDQRLAERLRGLKAQRQQRLEQQRLNQQIQRPALPPPDRQQRQPIVPPPIPRDRQIQTPVPIRPTVR